MATGKMLNLGGIDNRPPKANQTNGKFRVARNVYPTPDGRIIPRYEGQYYGSQPSAHIYTDIAKYGDDDVIKVVANDDLLYPGDDFISFYLQSDADPTLTVKIPRTFTYGDLGNTYAPEAYYTPQSGMNYRRNNTTYFMDILRGILKYDGVEVSRCGNTTPSFSCAEYTTTGTLKYIRVIKHKVDFDNNEALSEYVQFPVLAGTTSTNLNIKTGLNVTSIVNNTNPQVLPSSLQFESQGYPDNQFFGVPLFQDLTDDFLVGSPSNKVGVANGTTTITGLPGTYDLFTGMRITGAGVPANTTIASIVSGTSITVSAPVTAGTVTFSFNRQRSATAAGTVTLTGIPNTADLRVGMPVVGISGSAIPANTVIASIVSATSITLNNTVPAGALVFDIPFVFYNTIFNEVQEGSYVFVRISSVANNTFLGSGASGSSLGLALRIKSVDPLKNFILDTKDAYYMSQNREWVKTDLAYTDTTLMNTFATATKWGCREFLTVWASTSATGIYFYYGIQPYITALMDFPTVAAPIAIPQTPSAANAVTSYNQTLATLTVALNDMYDPYSKKLSPNSISSIAGTYNPFGGTLYRDFYCLAVYQDLLLLANDDLIWFSDTTLGGTFEQLNTINFIKVGDSEFGRITSICGTNDFFVVCRERKNYYVNGNISTGNYRVQEISTAEIGAWSNSSSIIVKDSVMFLTAVGVFQVTDGGRCVKVSESCPKNFSTYDGMNVNEDVSFRLDGFVSNLFDPDPYAAPTYRLGISVAYDEYRELLVFMKRDNGNPCLVLHTKTGEFYEWDGLISGTATKFGNCMAFINSKFYIGEIDLGSKTSQVKIESKSLPLSYPSTYPIKLYSTWLTAGEPSLEKNLLQLKLFGRVQSNGTSSSINVCHYKNWDISTKITNSAYFPNDTAASLNNQIQYSHKKRFNSDKVLSASVGFEVNSPSISFEIESFEVEFTQIQEGMKK